MISLSFSLFLFSLSPCISTQFFLCLIVTHRPAPIPLDLLPAQGGTGRACSLAKGGRQLYSKSNDRASQPEKSEKPNRKRRGHGFLCQHSQTLIRGLALVVAAHDQQSVHHGHNLAASRRENGNHVGRNHVGRFTRTGCTGMSVQAHGLHH